MKNHCPEKIMIVLSAVQLTCYITIRKISSEMKKKKVVSQADDQTFASDERTFVVPKRLLYLTKRPKIKGSKKKNYSICN